MKPITVATWNIHGGVGLDGRRMPARIVGVLVQMDADVIALQECAAPLGAFDEFRAELEQRLAMRACAGVTFRTRHREFGNVVLSRRPILDAQCIDLSYGTREPRNAIEMTIGIGGAPLRVIATHLGLAAAERRAQVARLADRLAETGVPTILLGDFNESKQRGTLAAWTPHVEFVTTPPTFPSWCPLLRLDRIFAMQPLRASLRVQRDRRSRIASDHLPLLADIDVAALDRTAATQSSRITMRAGSRSEEEAP
jgi:endonuclease/exonuclease/phosphatase family metal-dependent hydrolase